ncbi:MAG: transposase [candidate division Zixibacteria bacterium]|nr:transposase [candidate division Zixibacteria bacterium]
MKGAMMPSSREHNPESVVREIKRVTRRKFSTEEKIRIVLEGLKGEASIAELCRREGIVPNLYYRWSKDFLEAGKKRLKGNSQRETNNSKMADLRQENKYLQQLVAEISFQNRVLKKV